MLCQFFSLPGIENGIEYRYFSRYRIEVRNSSIVTTLTSTANNPLCYRPQIFFHIHMNYSSYSIIQESIPIEEVPVCPQQIKITALGLKQALTVVAVVIHEDNLLQQVGGRSMDRWMNGTQDDWQRLVHKDEDDADLWETGGVRDVSAPAD